MPPEEGEDEDAAASDVEDEEPDVPSDSGGQESPAGRTARVVCGVLAVIALALVIASSVVLAVGYRGEGGFLVTEETRDMSWWAVRVHVGTSILAVPLVAIWAILTAHDVWSIAGTRLKATTVMGGGSAVIFALLTPLTWPLIAFDNVAMTSVTVGSNVEGLWWPAFDDRVLFLLIDGREVSQSEFAGPLFLHLAAPVVALVSMGLVTLIVSGARHSPPTDSPPTDSTDSTDEPVGADEPVQPPS